MSTSKRAPDRRRSGGAVRADALAAGRALLLEAGPGALTLKAVGAALGMSHANLIHHFGSAGRFQAELLNAMVAEVTERVTAIIERQAPPRPDGKAPDALPAIIDAVFEAHATDGIARLVAWLSLSGRAQHTDTLVAATARLVGVVARLVEASEAAPVDARAAETRARDIVTIVSMLAFANAAIGPALGALVGGGSDPRQLTARLVGAIAAGGKVAQEARED